MKKIGTNTAGKLWLTLLLEDSLPEETWRCCNLWIINCQDNLPNLPVFSWCMKLILTFLSYETLFHLWESVNLRFKFDPSSKLQSFPVSCMWVMWFWKFQIPLVGLSVLWPLVLPMPLQHILSPALLTTVQLHWLVTVLIGAFIGSVSFHWAPW